MLGCSQPQDCRDKDLICALNDERWNDAWYLQEPDYLSELEDMFPGEVEDEI